MKFNFQYLIILYLFLYFSTVLTWKNLVLDRKVLQKGEKISYKITEEPGNSFVLTMYLRLKSLFSRPALAEQYALFSIGSDNHLSLQIFQDLTNMRLLLYNHQNKLLEEYFPDMKISYHSWFFIGISYSVGQIYWFIEDNTKKIVYTSITKVKVPGTLMLKEDEIIFNPSASLVFLFEISKFVLEGGVTYQFYNPPSGDYRIDYPQYFDCDPGCPSCDQNTAQCSTCVGSLSPCPAIGAVALDYFYQYTKKAYNQFFLVSKLNKQNFFLNSKSYSYTFWVKYMMKVGNIGEENAMTLYYPYTEQPNNSGSIYPINLVKSNDSRKLYFLFNKNESLPIAYKRDAWILMMITINANENILKYGYVDCSGGLYSGGSEINVSQLETLNELTSLSIPGIFRENSPFYGIISKFSIYYNMVLVPQAIGDIYGKYIY